MPFAPLKFDTKKQTLKLLDQRLLPTRETWIDCKDDRKVHWAIREMVVRGAPAIGIVGGYGLYLSIKKERESQTKTQFVRKLKAKANYMKSPRPTAVNLRNIIDRIVVAVEDSKSKTVSELKKKVLSEAKKAHREDDQLCRNIGKHGQKLFKSGDQVLTHCNAGGLATTGYGTALGVLYATKSAGKKFSVFVDETRPLLQGARLTAWELSKSKIPCRLICDNTAASLMQAGEVDRIVVGADRIAANGDTANKIGTYNLAVLAKAHGIPFYIAAPSTTFDFKIKTGKQIPIENRHEKEVIEGMGKRISPKGVKALNFAFDVTPHFLISAFITEMGVLKPPYSKSLKKLK